MWANSLFYIYTHTHTRIHIYMGKSRFTVVSTWNSLFLHYYLWCIVLFSIQTRVTLLLLHPVYLLLILFLWRVWLMHHLISFVLCCFWWKLAVNLIGVHLYMVSLFLFPLSKFSWSPLNTPAFLLCFSVWISLSLFYFLDVYINIFQQIGGVLDYYIFK